MKGKKVARPLTYEEHVRAPAGRPGGDDAVALVGAAVEHLGSTEVARQLGVASEGTVRHWVNGTSSPRPKAVKRILEVYGYPNEVPWDMSRRFGPDSAQKSAPKGVKARPASVSESGIVPKAAQGSPAPTIDTSDPEKTAIAVLDRLASELHAAKADRLPSLANSITKAAKLVAELRGLVDVTESQVLRSPAWVKLRNAIWSALEHYPEAMKAVNDAIAQLDAP